MRYRADLRRASRRQALRHPLLPAAQSGLQTRGRPPVSAQLPPLQPALLVRGAASRRAVPRGGARCSRSGTCTGCSALESWRARHGAEVRGWFEALAELEALSRWRASRTIGRTSPSPRWSSDGPEGGGQGAGPPAAGHAGAQRRVAAGPGPRAAHHRLEHVRQDDAVARDGAQRGAGAGRGAGVRAGADACRRCRCSPACG